MFRSNKLLRRSYTLVDARRGKASSSSTSGKGGAALDSALQGLGGNSVPTLTGLSAATNGFSSSRHDWVAPEASRLLRNDGGKLTLAYQASGGN